MPLLNAGVSATANLVLLAGLPFLFYLAYHKWRHKRTFAETARRAGLQVGKPAYLLYCLAFSLVGVAVLVAWPPPIAPFVRHGSPQQSFLGLGLTGPAVILALLYGVLKTGLPEEFLFRGLIAGSLSRRLPLLWANLCQASIFLIPHLLVLRVMPEMWAMLPLIFLGALFLGWVRVRSESILGPCLVHASLNLTMCLSVAVRSVP